MSSFTTHELRDKLTPIHSRIDDVIELLTLYPQNILTPELKELKKCDKELKEFFDEMDSRDEENI